MNLPNQLTVSRMALTAVFLIALFSGWPGSTTVALIVFILAGVTDWYDGKIAREQKLITNFGILMDPLADKILTCSAFIALVELHRMAAWMVIVIVSRELAITGLRLVAASQKRILSAERLGKHKTLSQLLAIGFTLGAMSYRDWGAASIAFWGSPVVGRPWLEWLADGLKWLAVILTIVSGVRYLWQNREIYLHDL